MMKVGQTFPFHNSRILPNLKKKCLNIMYVSKIIRTFAVRFVEVLFRSILVEISNFCTKSVPHFCKGVIISTRYIRGGEVITLILTI